jgi:hypothetical protein
LVVSCRTVHAVQQGARLLLNCSSHTFQLLGLLESLCFTSR